MQVYLASQIIGNDLGFIETISLGVLTFLNHFTFAIKGSYNLIYYFQFQGFNDTTYLGFSNFCEDSYESSYLWILKYN